MKPRKPIKRSWLRKKAKKARVLKSGRVILDAAGWARMRQKLYDRAWGQCEGTVDREGTVDGDRCPWPINLATFHTHHKKFRSHGGSDAKENLLALCESCHAKFHPGPQWSKGSKRA